MRAKCSPGHQEFLNRLSERNQLQEENKLISLRLISVLGNRVVRHIDHVISNIDASEYEAAEDILLLQRTLVFESMLAYSSEFTILSKFLGDVCDILDPLISDFSIICSTHDKYGALIEAKALIYNKAQVLGVELIS